MNTWDIVSYWRNSKKLDSEGKVRTPELLKIINLGYNSIGRALYPIFSDDLVIEFPAGTFSSTDTLYVPDDALVINRVFRETVKDSGVYKPCTEVAVEMKELIGVDPSYPLRTDYPYYVHEGRKLLIYPAFPADPDPGVINIKIIYRKRLADLVMGSSTIGVAASDALTLDVLASRRDDIYNDYEMAIFKKDGEAWELNKILKVSDYAGSTRICSFRDASGDDEFDAATTYMYALYPFIPEEYHVNILDAVRVELIKAEFLEGDAVALKKVLDGEVNQIMRMTGFADLVGRQD